MIQVQDLVKWYGPTLAVNGVSFNIEKGEIIGFLGPNGAGKSTTLRILTGFMPATSGRAAIAGFDVFHQSEQARMNIGYLPETNPLYPEMRVEEYLHFRGKLQKMDRARRNTRIDEVCERCGLGAIRGRVIGQLSRGNRQRVGLAQALLHDPPVLILDEPTVGLDPNQIAQFRSLVNELRGRHTVLVSTHILTEVEKTADRVLILAHGKLVASGSPDDLRREAVAGRRVIVEAQAPMEAVRRVLTSLESTDSVEVESLGPWCRAVVMPRPRAQLCEPVGRALAAHGWTIRELRYERLSLEEFFTEITSKPSS